MSQEELLRANRKRKNNYRKTAIMFWAIMTVVTAKIPGWLEEHAMTLVDKDEFLDRLPFGACFWGIISVLFYCAWVKKYEHPQQATAVVCPGCDTVKAVDGAVECPCGGQFVNMDEMKWVLK